MRDKRAKFLVVSLLLFTVLLTGVYALLGGALNITGTATGVGNFKIEFSTFNVTNPDKATVTADVNNTSLDIAANLSFPGDSVTINFTIANTGGLKAVVDDLIVNNNGNEDFTINIVGLTDIVGNVLNVGETTNGSITITWNPTSTNPTPEDVNFDLTISYLQAT